VNRLETTLTETRDELDLLREKAHAEITQLEETITRLEQDLVIEQQASSQLSKELQVRDEHLQVTSIECQTLQEQLGQRIQEVSSDI